MYTAEKVANRILELCEEKNISLNQLSKLSKVPPSTIKNIVYGNTQNPGVVTIKKLCEGFGIEFREFFK